jgi:hypothetical protein
MPSSTRHVTVVAVYSSLSIAQAAASDLESNGFPNREIYLHSEETGAATNWPERTSTLASHAEGGISGWFKSLFGSEGDLETQRDYEDAFKSGNTILALDTTEENAERAAEVLNPHSPINVHAEAGPAGAETVAGTSVGTRGSVGARPSRPSSMNARQDESESTDVAKGEVKLEKGVVIRGAARIHSRVV